jgi:hypothetical protein
MRNEERHSRGFWLGGVEKVFLTAKLCQPKLSLTSEASAEEVAKAGTLRFSQSAQS